MPDTPAITVSECQGSKGKQTESSIAIVVLEIIVEKCLQLVSPRELIKIICKEKV